MKKIIGLVGTNSEQSTNRQLLQFMQHYFAQEAVPLEHKRICVKF